MASDADYINQALKAGVPLESIERFLSDNPGDHERLFTAFAENILPGPDDYDRDWIRRSFSYDPSGIVGSNGHERAADILGAFIGSPVRSDQPTTIAGEPLPTTQPGLPPSQWDRNLIANVNEGSPVGWEMQPSGWRDTIGTIIGALPIPGAGIIGPIVGGFPGQFPMPRPMPRLPAPRAPGGPGPGGPGPGGPGGGMMGRIGRAIPTGKWAKIAAAAAALGISVEEYIRRFGVPRKTPSMNPLNPRALRRAMTRTERFATFARGAIRMAECYQRPKKTTKKGCRPGGRR